MRVPLALSALTLLVLAGLASAATVTGTQGPDRLTGTPRSDVLDGRGGNDVLSALGGADLTQGGFGRDTINAGPGNDRIPTALDGATDRIRCGAGRDVVTAELRDVVANDCEVVSRQLSADTTTDPVGQHATQVEPDSFAFGSTVVGVYQVGRVSQGGAVAIGFSTSRDAGRTWRSGLLPGVTDSSPQPVPDERASDPVVAYDALHGVWLAATLGISPATSSFHLYVSRSQNGVEWNVPVAAVTGALENLDKEWIVCDNGAASPFRGRCYLSYLQVNPWQMFTVSSSDGGLTWSAPVPTSPPREPGRSFQGAQPVVQPNGTLVVVYGAYAEREGFQSEIVASRSTDGGTTFSGPVSVAPISMASIPAVRTFALPSAEVDALGRVYAAWEGCLGSGACETSRINVASSADGITWTAARATPGPASVDHFMPGLGADPAARGRIALVYHSIPDDCANDSTCAGIDVFLIRSTNGGRTWTRPQRLTAEPVALDWIARTRSGLMLGDYVSTSFVRGVPVSIFVLATSRLQGRFREAAFAHRDVG